VRKEKWTLDDRLDITVLSLSLYIYISLYRGEEEGEVGSGAIYDRLDIIVLSLCVSLSVSFYISLSVSVFPFSLSLLSRNYPSSAMQPHKVSCTIKNRAAQQHQTTAHASHQERTHACKKKRKKKENQSNPRRANPTARKTDILYKPQNEQRTKRLTSRQSVSKRLSSHPRLALSRLPLSPPSHAEQAATRDPQAPATVVGRCPSS
jgi:hypothetical protein